MDSTERGQPALGHNRCRGRRLGPAEDPLRENDPDPLLLDGTLAVCDCVADSRADDSAEHRRHGVTVQVVTGPTGKVLTSVAKAVLTLERQR